MGSEMFFMIDEVSSLLFSVWNYETHRLVDKELEVTVENLIGFKDGSSGQEA